ncbi:MAG: hypothetical protein ABJR05_02480 [Balneola sp.]
MHLRILLTFISVVIIIAGCGFTGNEEKELNELIAPENELIPLEVGNYWVYEQWYLDPSFKDTVREEVIGKRRIVAEDIIVDAFESVRFRYDTRPADDAILPIKANGPDGHYFLGAWAKVDSLYINNRRYKYPAKVGDVWKSTSSIYDSKNSRFLIGSSRTIELIDTTKTVVTAAGTFENCYVYKNNDFSPTSTLTHFYYIKPTVGIIGLDSRIDDEPELLGQWRILEYKLN